MGRKLKGVGYDAIHRFQTQAVYLTVRKKNKEVLFEKTEESLADAMALARKFYWKSGVHQILIMTGGSTCFDFNRSEYAF